MENTHDASQGECAEALTGPDFRKREEALREYYYTQELIDKFDERSLKIKSWSVTSCGLALGFGFVEKHPLLFCLAAFGSLVFWYLESLWKLYQYIAAARSAEIEKLLSLDNIIYTGSRIVDSFEKNFNEGIETKKIFKVMFYRNVRVPHLFIFLVGILLFLISVIYGSLQASLGY